MKNFILLCLLSATCLAQEAPCGLRSVTDITPLLYPPIAKAAHMGGMVILMVSFMQSGEVQNVEILSGPKLLQESASSYAKGLRANVYGGTRTCPIVIDYTILSDGEDLRAIKKTDLQHVTVYAKTIPLSDPEMTVEKRRKRFWLF